MQQVMETIGLNDEESRQQHERKIELLTQENSILLSHLEDYKVCYRLDIPGSPQV